MEVLSIWTLLFMLGLLRFARGDIFLYSNKSFIFIRIFEDYLSKSGPSVPFGGIKGNIEGGRPLSGCTTMEPASLPNTFAIVERFHNCSFEEKVRNAQAANYSAVIIFNVESNALVPMSYNGTGILIPAVFVGASSGETLLEYTEVEGVYVVIDDSFHVSADMLFLFTVFVFLAFLFMLGSLCLRWFRNRRRRRRNLLPASVLKSIPKCKFDKNMVYETCVICQENFKLGETIRILPCSHAYHANCIDVWLTQYRRVCAVCKRRVMGPLEEPVSCSDSEAEPDDRTPLLGPDNVLRRGGGTFQSISQRLGLRRERDVNVNTTGASASINAVDAEIGALRRERNQGGAENVSIQSSSTSYDSASSTRSSASEFEVERGGLFVNIWETITKHFWKAGQDSSSSHHSTEPGTHHHPSTGDVDSEDLTRSALSTHFQETHHSTAHETHPYETHSNLAAHTYDV